MLPVEQRPQPLELAVADRAAPWVVSPPWLGSSLYIQWAATPNSARSCISRVRIWISSGLPSGPITVVCSDWYMLNFGIAMKSLKRPGSGFHSEWITPTAP